MPLEAVNKFCGRRMSGRLGEISKRFHVCAIFRSEINAERFGASFAVSRDDAERVRLESVKIMSKRFDRLVRFFKLSITLRMNFLEKERRMGEKTGVNKHRESDQNHESETSNSTSCVSSNAEPRG